jgi:plasmid stabilization system protein ParE
VAFVSWTANAQNDLEAIYLFIARSAPAAAYVVIDRILGATNQLESFPQMGRRIPDSPQDDLRELIVGNYRIAYRSRGEEVEVLAVHHGSRNPGSFPTG